MLRQTSQLGGKVALGGAALDLARQRDTFMLVEIIIAIAIDSLSKASL